MEANVAVLFQHLTLIFLLHDLSTNRMFISKSHYFWTVLFFCHREKMFWWTKIKEERAYSVSWFQVQSVIVRKSSRSQVFEADGPIDSTVRKQKGSNTYCNRVSNLTIPLDLNTTDSMIEVPWLKAVKLSS